METKKQNGEKIFEGYSFYVSLAGEPPKIKKEVADVIKKRGGEICFGLNKSTTHVIASEKEINEDSSKVKQAYLQSSWVLPPTWVFDSDTCNLRVNEIHYILIRGRPAVEIIPDEDEFLLKTFTNAWSNMVNVYLSVDGVQQSFVRAAQNLKGLCADILTENNKEITSNSLYGLVDRTWEVLDKKELVSFNLDTDNQSKNELASGSMTSRFTGVSLGTNSSFTKRPFTSKLLQNQRKEKVEQPRFELKFSNSFFDTEDDKLREEDEEEFSFLNSSTGFSLSTATMTSAERREKSRQEREERVRQQTLEKQRRLQEIENLKLAKLKEKETLKQQRFEEAQQRQLQREQERLLRIQQREEAAAKSKAALLSQAFVAQESVNSLLSALDGPVVTKKEISEDELQQRALKKQKRLERTKLALQKLKAARRQRMLNLQRNKEELARQKEEKLLKIQQEKERARQEYQARQLKKKEQQFQIQKQAANNDDKKLFVGGIHFNDLARKIEDLKKKLVRAEKHEQYLQRQSRRGPPEQRFSAKKLHQETLAKNVLQTTSPLAVKYETEEDLSNIKAQRVQNLVKLIGNLGNISQIKDFALTKQHLFITFDSAEECEKVLNALSPFPERERLCGALKDQLEKQGGKAARLLGPNAHFYVRRVSVQQNKLDKQSSNKKKSKKKQSPKAE